MPKKDAIGKGKMLNYLYGLKCDLQCERSAAIEADRSESYIETLKEEEEIVSTIIRHLKGDK